MKTRAFIALAVLSLFLASPALADELSVTGQGVNLKDGPTVYEVGGEALFSVGEKGYFLIGPAVVLSDADELTRAGVAADWNLTTSKGGPFLGVTAHYFLEDVEGLDKWTATARAGLKFPVGKGALLKVFLSQPCGGRFNDIADISGNIGIAAKF